MNNEESVVFAKHAAIYTYDEFTLKWNSIDGGSSQVIILHNVLNDLSRIVGLPDGDTKYVLNAPIWGLMKPQKFSHFIQWRDPKAIYGISFESPEYSTNFFDKLEEIIKKKNVTVSAGVDLTTAGPNLPARELVVKEIYTTEQSYVATLETLVNKIYTPLNAEKKLMNLLSADEKKTIFQNIETIYKFNKQFMNDLREKLVNWSETQFVGDVFEKSMHFFKLYKIYMSNYETAIQTLEKAQKKKEIAQWLKSCESSTEGHKLPFLLIQPVQRIPRYHLLLQELDKKTPESHPDKKNISSALANMKEIADHANFSVRDTENRNKLLQLTADPKKYIGFQPLLLPHRFLIHESDVKIADKVQWLLLFNDILVIASVTGEKQKEKRTVEDTLEIDKVWFTDPNENENVIEIVHPKITLVAHLNKREEKHAWMNYAQKAIADQLRNLKRVVKGDGTPERGIREFEYEFPDGKSKYSGDWDLGKPHGLGIYHFSENVTYSGNWVHGRMEGKGKILWFQKGDSYEGDWKADLPDGYGKLITFQSTYEGQWVKGQKHGKGVITWPNGDYYDGEWFEDAMQGTGSWVCTNGTRYDGEFKLNMFHGKGKLENLNGVYEGQMDQDMRHGKGVMKYKTGGVYEGDWSNDLREGTGKFTSGDGKITYEGEWCQDRMYGKGKYVAVGKFTYEGSMKDDRLDGCGHCVYDDGSKYLGSFVENKKEGTGRMEYTDGSLYDGLWRGDKKQGNGTLTYSDGSIYEGSWEKDFQEGNGVFTWPDGSKYSGQWKGGKRHGRGTFSSAGDAIKYTGDWVANQRHGKGVQTDSTGTYDGDWQYDKRHGKGKLTNNGFSYYGTWFNDLMDASGIANFPNTPPISYCWQIGQMELPTMRVAPPLLPAQKIRLF